MCINRFGSETGPRQGTLQVFPNVLLSNAYLILRPFFTHVTDAGADLYDAKNWKYGKYDFVFYTTTLE